MALHISSNHQSNKSHCVCVPPYIHYATVELLKARGLPVYMGSELAILHFEKQSHTLYSTMSGVVDRVLVNNNETVSKNQRLFEIRNTNINRDKSGHQMQYMPGRTYKPHFMMCKSTNKSCHHKTTPVDIESFEQTQMDSVTSMLTPSILTTFTIYPLLRAGLLYSKLFNEPKTSFTKSIDPHTIKSRR